jgi:5-hydroxyisourate hydrolase
MFSRKVMQAQCGVARRPLSWSDAEKEGGRMGRLSTHVLDTARGKPAAGVKITLYRLSGQSHRKVKEAVTNADGRTDGPLLEGKDLAEGQYELVFAAGDYLRAGGQAEGQPGAGILFLDEIPVRFGIADASQHYHVPLLLSPFGYATYRGS